MFTRSGCQYAFFPWDGCQKFQDRRSLSRSKNPFIPECAWGGYHKFYTTPYTSGTLSHPLWVWRSVVWLCGPDLQLGWWRPRGEGEEMSREGRRKGWREDRPLESRLGDVSDTSVETLLVSTERTESEGWRHGSCDLSSSKKQSPRRVNSQDTETCLGT